MQIRVDKLRENLALLQPVVPKKATLPVTTCVLVSEGELTATDLENRLTVTLSEAQGVFLLPYRSVMELLKYVPGDDMLTLDPGDKTIRLSWREGSAAYEVKDAQDYPPSPPLGFTAESNLNGDRLIDTLLAALPYCATESTRPVLTGVTLYLGNVLQVAGADGFRLSYQSLNQSYPAEQTIVIPADTVKVLGYLWQKCPPAVPLEDDLIHQLMSVRQLKLSLAEGTAVFRFGRITLAAKLIAGNPPDHLALLNGFKEPVKVKVMAPEMRNAVRRLEGIVREGTGIVRLEWTEDAMTVSASSDEKGEIRDSIQVQPGSTAGRVALNVKYLLDYLEGKEGLVTLGKDQGTSPVLFHYGNKPIVAVMPMSVKWGDEKPPEPEEPQQEEAVPAEQTEEGEPAGVAGGASTSQPPASETEAAAPETPVKRRGRRKKV